MREINAMENALSETKAKELVAEVLAEMITDRREVLHEIVVEALEDVGLAHAIKQGRQGELVSEKEIFEILEG